MLHFFNAFLWLQFYFHYFSQRTVVFINGVKSSISHFQLGGHAFQMSHKIETMNKTDDFLPVFIVQLIRFFRNVSLYWDNMRGIIMSCKPVFQIRRTNSCIHTYTIPFYYTKIFKLLSFNQCKEKCMVKNWQRVNEY